MYADRHDCTNIGKTGTRPSATAHSLCFLGGNARWTSIDDQLVGSKRVADAGFQVKAGVSLAFNGGNMAFMVEQLLKQRHTEAKPELFAVLLIEEPVLHAGEGYQRERRAPVARIECELPVRRGGKSIHCGPIAAIRLH